MSNASQTTTWTVRDARDSVKRMSDHTPAEAVVASANPFARPQHSSRHLSQHRITARWSQPPMMRESSLLDDDESYMEPVEIMEAVETDLRQVKTARPVQLPSPKRLYADERSKSRSPSPTENDQSKHPQQFEDPKPVSEQQQPERSTTSALTRPNFVEGPMASAPTNIEEMPEYTELDRLSVDKRLDQRVSLSNFVEFRRSSEEDARPLAEAGSANENGQAKQLEGQEREREQEQRSSLVYVTDDGQPSAL